MSSRYFCIRQALTHLAQLPRPEDNSEARKSSYKSPLQHEVRKSGKRLVLIGKGTEHEGVPGAIRVETQTEVKNEGGHVVVTGENIQVNGADAVTLYISAATNFVNYKDVSGDANRK